MKAFRIHELNALRAKKAEAICKGFNRLSRMLALLVPPDEYTFVFEKLQEAFLLALRGMGDLRENRKD